jgi:hypothetical protein
MCIELIIAFSILAFIFLQIFSKDGSFITKIQIFESLKRMPENKLSNNLFGFGIEEGRRAYSYIEGRFGHAHLSLIIGQFGILGLLLYIVCFIAMYVTTRGSVSFLIYAFIISGFSLIDLGPNLFWVFGIITVLSKRFYSK